MELVIPLSYTWSVALALLDAQMFSDVESADIDKNEIVLKTLAVFPTPSRRWRLRTRERPGEFQALLAGVRFG
eukprot:SAG31_NODE_37527_length_303_cov_1.009804_1_plen_72_part_10